MAYKNFEDYLQTKHSEQNPSVLDDMLPDDYERWISDLSVDEWIEYGDKYAEICKENKQT